MPWTKIDPVFQPDLVRLLCIVPYAGHPKGCPNFGQNIRCPPKARLWRDVYDSVEPCFAVYTTFDLASHVARMKERHPGWSERQLRCCLYWQGTARKHLNREILSFCLTHPRYSTETTPEAMGCNVTETLCKAGVALEWPPVNMATLVAFAGVQREEAIERGRQTELDLPTPGGGP